LLCMRQMIPYYALFNALISNSRASPTPLTPERIAR